MMRSASTLRWAFSVVVLTPMSGHAQSGLSIGSITDTSDLPGIALSLTIVVAVIVLLAWIVRRTPLGAASRRSGPLKLIASLPVGPKERLLLVEAAGCELVVGVSPAGIFALHQKGDAETAELLSGAAPAHRYQGQSVDAKMLLGDAE